MSKDDLLAFPVIVPPSVEQTQIARFLDYETARIDALIAEQERLIALLKEKRQAVISHAVTKGCDRTVPMKYSGVEWLGEVPEHWSSPALKYMCRLLKDGTHLPPPRVDKGVPLLSVRNIVSGKFVNREDDSNISYGDYEDLCRAFVPEVDDVLLAIVGATLGKVAVVREGMNRFHIQRSLAIFRTNPSELLSEWLYLVLQSSNFQALLWENVGFSAQPGIYLGTLSGFAIPTPPLHEQSSIISVVKKEIQPIEELLELAELSCRLIKERRSALISAAVTGKIDVRNWQPPTNTASTPTLEAVHP